MIYIFSEEQIGKLEQELVNANDLLTAMKSQSELKNLFEQPQSRCG